MPGDCHCYTRHSTGSYRSEELVARACAAGLRFVSCVDHDTTDAIPELLSCGTSAGITVIPGVTISTVDPTTGRRAHIVGYSFHMPAVAIDALCVPIRETRHRTSLLQIETLRQAGYGISLEEIRGIAQGETDCALSEQCMGRGWPHDPLLYEQHIMTALVRNGYADAIDSPLYRELFGVAGICAASPVGCDPLDALRAVKNDGGIAVLAQPAVDDSWDLLPSLLEAGLDGLELVHPRHTYSDHRRIRTLADRYDLILTGGAACRGEFGGASLGELVAPPAAFQKLTQVGDEKVRFTAAVVREAAQVARKAVVADVDARLKGGDIRNLVTQHDVDIEQLIVTRIRERHPSDLFVTEEQDRSRSDGARHTWIIDPIDGTTNFVTQGEYFAISVARYRGEHPEFGIVYDVMADRMYVGIAGAGAYCDGQRLGPVREDVPKPLDECVVEASLVAARSIEKAGADISVLVRGTRAQRARGCASLGICRIATGRQDIYLSSRLSLWDYAAAAIVLNELGGVVAVAYDHCDSQASDGRAHMLRARCLIIASGSTVVLNEMISALFPDESKRPQFIPFAKLPA
jgi:fructose-1,6-bisphosphatase/inositol monophosphatase family enzyme/predicted metal-dependent phosphoesterase TrpH